MKQRKVIWFLCFSIPEEAELIKHSDNTSIYRLNDIIFRKSYSWGYLGNNLYFFDKTSRAVLKRKHLIKRYLSINNKPLTILKEKVIGYCSKKEYYGEF